MKLQNFIKELYKARIRALALISKKRAGDTAFRIFCTPIGKGNYTLTPLLRSAGQLSLQFGQYHLKGYQWNKGAGRKLLIAHGFRSHTQRFEHLVPLLIEKGYEVVAFDAPAHGLSSGKQINAIDYTQLVSVLAHLYGPFDAYIGHSFGGLAVTLAVSELPQPGPVKIVLFAPASDTVGLAATFLKQMEITDPEVHRHFYNNVIRLSGKDLGWFTIRRCLPALNGAILWIHDQEDRITPIQEALEIQRLAPPNIRFIFTRGLGHSKIYRDTAVLKEVAAFL
ncbi:alpha/beta hydrolase [Niabella drilacis]|uniref:Alpha/beta hydrolase family protein n=1 Tax=Niabella drilacis (strain DSM 25811 / CCM 8410 / CCUG 62505 / LMG 26954 / E90) TaxID=1285928 RepID=A0A1G6WS31_NIADE|nr:alpha/beta fold hydrolase [Niabella drilacis]SDD68692.1 Alpha/beta hydrolase family protein [Niabella drilacis]